MYILKGSRINLIIFKFYVWFKRPIADRRNARSMGQEYGSMGVLEYGSMGQEYGSRLGLVLTEGMRRVWDKRRNQFGEKGLDQWLAYSTSCSLPDRDIWKSFCKKLKIPVIELSKTVLEESFMLKGPFLKLKTGLRVEVEDHRDIVLTALTCAHRGKVARWPFEDRWALKPEPGQELLGASSAGRWWATVGRPGSRKWQQADWWWARVWAGGARGPSSGSSAPHATTEPQG